MGIFKRLFKVAESEAHAAIDKFEDPIKMTEQGIRDLKKDLQASLQSLAEVKALQIRTRRDAEEQKQNAASYEKKAMLLLQKAQSGALDSGEADRLAGEALAKKEAASTQALTTTRDLQKQDTMVAQLEANVKKLKSKISTWESELSTLKARAKVAGATRKLNEQLAQVDSSGTVAMLEKMKTKVAEEEALAQSYGEIALIETSVDAEIDKALASGSANEIKAADSLAALKAKMGMS
ncbi:MAG: PspA/IM30 family protein [Deltaproteobacteria bacterium]|nr:PspA/IM30 family protein [Deltaproteobacteria bacterium]